LLGSLSGRQALVETEPFQVMYLTGAPAAGKSTISRKLRELVSPLEVFEYGQRLTEYLARDSAGLTQVQIRARSAGIVRPEDIAAVDQQLLEFVREARQRSHVLIDSHPVTKEDYGFRITAFGLEEIQTLRPTRIVLLYTPPDVVLQRIKADSGGRPLVTPWEAQFHTDLQASVAAVYAVGLRCPMYLIDSSRPLEDVAAEVAKRFRTSTHQTEPDA
jgi:adenylate kinase